MNNLPIYYMQMQSETRTDEEVSECLLANDVVADTKDMRNCSRSPVGTTKCTTGYWKWLFIMLLQSIPIIGMIALVVLWRRCRGKDENMVNYCKAALIYTFTVNIFLILGLFWLYLYVVSII